MGWSLSRKGSRRRLESWNEILSSPMIKGAKKQKILRLRDEILSRIYAEQWAAHARRSFRFLEAFFGTLVLMSSFALPFIGQIAITVAVIVLILVSLGLRGVSIFGSISVRFQQNEAAKSFRADKVENPSPAPRDMQRRVKELPWHKQVLMWFKGILGGAPLSFFGLFAGFLANAIYTQSQEGVFAAIFSWLGFALTFTLNALLGRSSLWSDYEKMMVMNIRARKIKKVKSGGG